MIIIRDRLNYLRWEVEADQIILSGCGDATLNLTLVSVCEDNRIYSFQVDCDIPVGFYDYQLLLAGQVVGSGKISVR